MAKMVHYGARVDASVRKEIRQLANDLGMFHNDLFKLLLKIARANPDVKALIEARKKLFG